MKSKSTTLTKEERDTLVLGGIHPDGKQLSNAEMGQALGTSASRVKTTIHQACLKLQARNRNEAIILALMRGEISLNEIYSLDELAQRFSSLNPDMLRRLAYLVRQGLKHGRFLGKDEEIIGSDIRQGTKLTKIERDVVILAGRRLTNSEIASRLYIHIGTVRKSLNRACAKLGAHRRADAVVLAVKQGEISILDIFSPNELIQFLAPLGAESIEKMAQLVTEKFKQGRFRTAGQ